MDDTRKWGTNLNSLPLLEAVLCADCEIISNTSGDRCQICGSPSLLSLGRVLGGSIEGNRAALVHEEGNHLRNGFTVLVNPAASNILQQRRRRRG